MLGEIRRIAEVEFASIVTDVAMVGIKLRIILTDTSYVDVWVSKKLENIWMGPSTDTTIFPIQIGSTSRLIPSTSTMVRRMS
jgi:hypothetical protein